MTLTVGKLKELMKDLPDDTVIVASDKNYDQNGRIDEIPVSHVRVETFNEIIGTFPDDEDAPVYHSHMYVKHNEGDKRLLYFSQSPTE